MRRVAVFLALSLLACSGESSPPPSAVDDETDDEPAAEVDAGHDTSHAKLDATVVRDAAPVVDGSSGALVDAGAVDAAVEASVLDAARPDADAGAPDAADAGLPPFVAKGPPIVAPDRTWTWVPFTDSYCRDGSSAGVAVNFNAARDDLVIFLEGGGACFEGLSCLANPATAQHGPRAATGIFDLQNPKNPLRDFSFVYVPYCTGDVHAGTNAAATVPGVLGTQRFVGRRNMEAYLRRVVPTFPGVKRVLLTGISAGGFGAASNAVLVQRAFPGVKVMLLDDSGPPMSSDVVAPCLQKQWRELWGLDDSILADCGSDCANPDDFLFDFGRHLAATYADRSAGLIETAQDGVISGFFGAGLNDCTGVVLLTPVPGADFSRGLVEFRAALKDYPNFGTWFAPGSQHTWLSSDSLYTGTIGDRKLVDWVAELVAGRSSHVGL